MAHHGLGRAGSARTVPLEVAAAREADLAGISATRMVLAVRIISFMSIVIEEWLVCMASALEKGMAIDWLFRTVDGRRNGPSKGECDSKGRKSDDHAHCLVSACCEFRSIPYRRAIHRSHALTAL
jgi:hypothetical protein